MKVAAVDKTLVAFLIEPPPQALPAIQEAWDHAADARFGVSYIETKLGSELRKIGLKSPSRSALNHWVGAIQANLIARPKANLSEGRAVSTTADPAYLPLKASDLSAMTNPAKQPFLTPEDTLREITDRMIHEEEQALQQHIREQARRNVATRLRGMLEQMGALDA